MVLVVTTAISACSSDENITAPTIAATTTTTIPARDVSDGRLVIGALLPLSDSLIGEPMESAVEIAVERINAAGGVLGTPVRLEVADEGATSAAAGAAIQSLLDKGVDAIVGPASSLTALSTLADIVASGTLACSPTASALALDGFPDNGLFFRTIPSDSLQARAIAEAADQTGAQRATIVYVDDTYGRPFADAVEAALENRAISVIDRIPFSTSEDDLTGKARQLTSSDAQVAIVLAAADDGTRFLEATDASDTSDLSAVIVNDALRNPAAPQRIQGLSPEFRDKILGIAPQAESDDASAPFDPPGPYAANAFDCTNLIALAAVKSGSDAARDIAGQLAQLSVSGSVCSSFAACVASIEAGLQIDYDGPSGLTDLQIRRGDPSQAVFDRFLFDDSGRDVLERTVIVGT